MEARLGTWGRNRLLRSPTWRERGGMSCPAFGRLDLQIEQGKRTLTIRELRCDASDFRDVGWEEDERGICVIAMELCIAPGGYSLPASLIFGVARRGASRSCDDRFRVERWRREGRCCSWL